jgi:hypothetical protein
MRRMLAFLILFASCAAVANAQSCVFNGQTWQSTQRAVRCVAWTTVRVAGAALVCARWAEEPAVAVACTVNRVYPMAQWADRNARPMSVPPPRPLYNYYPPPLPYQYRQYTPSYPNYGPVNPYPPYYYHH